jgi:hypothetical protein
MFQKLTLPLTLQTAGNAVLHAKLKIRVLVDTASHSVVAFSPL